MYEVGEFVGRTKIAGRAGIGNWVSVSGSLCWAAGPVGCSGWLARIIVSLAQRGALSGYHQLLRTQRALAVCTVIFALHLQLW